VPYRYLTLDGKGTGVKFSSEWFGDRKAIGYYFSLKADSKIANAIKELSEYIEKL